MDFDTLRVHQEGGVLFATIAAPPMNLLGTELVRDLVSLIQRAEADSTLQVLVFVSADIVDNQQGLIEERTVSLRPYPAVKLFRDSMYASLKDKLPPDVWDYSTP